MNHKRFLARVSAASLAIGLCSTAAFANAAAEPTATDPAAPAAAAPEAAPPADSGDIVVTAQKRAENVQDVPISIAAFSGATLEKNNVVNLEGLTKVTPNLSVAKGAQTSYVRLAIRGIGAASNTT